MPGMCTGTFELLDVTRIQLDCENPRIKKLLEIYSGETPTEEQLALALRQDGSSEGTSFQALRQSILTNRGIIHPIIVNRDPNGRYVAIEGNTRLHIYLDNLDRGEPGNWAQIPALIHDDLDQSTIESIRLQAHLVGVRQWDPYSKAKYLHLLRSQEHLTIDQIVDYCGGNKREVLRYIDAYVDMEKHYRLQLNSDAEFDPRRFSAFVELQSNRLTSALIANGFEKKDFAKWVIDGKFSPTDTVRKLPQILQNKASREAFIDSDAANAIKLLDVPLSASTIVDASRLDLARELCRRVGQVPYEEIQAMRLDPNPEELDIMEDLKGQLESYCNDLTTPE